MSRAFRSLDDDKRLTIAELSRHPGELRQLRYGGEWADKRFEELDYTGDDKLGGREFKIAPRDWDALDKDAFANLINYTGGLHTDARGKGRKAERIIVQHQVHIPPVQRECLDPQPDFTRPRSLNITIAQFKALKA